MSGNMHYLSKQNVIMERKRDPSCPVTLAALENVSTLCMCVCVYAYKCASDRKKLCFCSCMILQMVWVDALCFLINKTKK